jgi:hypothetical protein
MKLLDPTGGANYGEELKMKKTAAESFFTQQSMLMIVL